MKLNQYFLIGTLAIAGLSSCVSESLDDGVTKDGQGRMALKVSVLEPTANTRAVTSVTNFPVIVYDASGKVVNSYATVADVPASVVLSVGNYTVESHTPGAIQKRMTAPYYRGLADMEIIKDWTTNVDVTCKMQNSSIKVNYMPNATDGQTMTDAFTSWSITLDDGSSTTLSFTNQDGLDPAIVYWLFEDGVSQLSLNFRATTQEGSSVSARRVLTKQQAEERYDDDSQYFGGGDAIVINVSPTESTEGKLTSITINASVTFAEDEETVNLDVTDDTSNLDDNGGGNGGENPGDNPQPGTDDAITLNLFQPITFTMGEGGSLDKSLGDVGISTEKGIKSLVVLAKSTNPDMVASLIAVGEGYGLDFVNAPGVEVVGNADLVKFFSGLGQTLSVPAEGDRTYDFPVGNFFVLLDVMSGTHTFNMTVTDMEGNTKSGSVVITVNE